MWVLLEEDERSINDGFFVTDPTGRIWFDFPAISAHRHDLTYVSISPTATPDSGVKDPRSFLVSMNKTEQPGNTDLARLARATATRK